MKRFFLCLAIFGSLIAFNSYAQLQPQLQKVVKPVMPTKPIPILTESKTKVLEDINRPSFQKFYDRLIISYWSGFTSSSLGQWNVGALDEKGTTAKSSVVNLFNQVSFNYNFGWKMNFVLNPRWTFNFPKATEQGTGQRGVMQLEDMLAGFQGVVYSTEDKKFNFWMRAAARLPTSPGSREANITFQPDIYMNPTFDVNKKWQLSGYAQYRQWVYNQQYTLFRYRLYTAPYIQYALNDTTRVQLFYETYWENRSRSVAINGNKPNLKAYWQDVMLGINHDFSPMVNFFPFLGYITDGRKNIERPLDNAWLGFWFSWRLK